MFGEQTFAQLRTGFRGNSAADSAAKDALVGDISVELIPIYHKIKAHIHICKAQW